MIKALFIIGILLSFIVVKAQQPKDTLNYFSLSTEQRKLWGNIEDQWTKEHFNTFLKKNKLKTTCAHCYSIRFNVLFSINEKGEMQVSLLSNYVCGKSFSKKQEEELVSHLKKIIFPATFYNKTLEFRIGRTLKC